MNNNIENFLKEKINSKTLEAEKIINDAKENDMMVLYHSGNASQDRDLSDGVEAGFGSWLEECLANSTDDDELTEKIRNQDPIAFFSEKPEWVSVMVSRYCNKNIREVTIKDIEQHGQLCILVIEKDDSDFRRAGCKTDHFVEHSTYLNSDEIADYELPFGVEKGDIYSVSSFNPVEITLTGNSLVEFLKRNFPYENILKENLFKNTSNDRSCKL